MDGHTIKASTFLTNKWAWLASAAPRRFLLRASIGRHGETHHLALDDADLITHTLADLNQATGLTTTPYAAAVTRWETGLPQYSVGHPSRIRRIRRIRDQVAGLGGLTLCGAAYDGVGIPACVAGGRRAAEAALAATITRTPRPSP